MSVYCASRASGCADTVYSSCALSFTVEEGTNRVFDSATVRLDYSSFISPPTVFDYSVDDRKLMVVKVTGKRRPFYGARVRDEH